MANIRLPFLFLRLIVFTCFTFLLCTEARHHKHAFKRHKHAHSRAHAPATPPTSGISIPPWAQPQPQPQDPPADPPTYTDPPTGVFDVLSFGAVGDGSVDDTEAFTTAWDSACSNTDTDSSVLHAPPGYTFMIQSTIFTGPCQSHIIFQIDGSVVPPDGPEAWPHTVSKRQWLVFFRIQGMSLEGGGRIDGRGQKWWDLPCKPHKGINGTTMPGPCDSPIAIRFFESSNLTVKGLKIQNSPQFHFRFDVCHNVHIESIHITAPALSPNTDGIHIENTNNVEIYNSVISNGDDCVSIGSGCYDVDIRNISCGPGHGISIGSLGNHNSRACVQNVTVRDSKISTSENGVRIKTWQGGSGGVSGVRFDNIRMEAVRNPIIIDQFYCQGRGCSNQSSAVFVRDIVYSSVKGTYDVRSPPMQFACSDTLPCANITLADIELLPAQGQMVLDAFCWNAYGSLDSLTIPPVTCLEQGEPPQPLLQTTFDHC